MSEVIDPVVIFDLLAHHVPRDLRQHLLVAGSLAAAYHHRDQLRDHAVNTKDADVVVQPAGAVKEAAAVARRLVADGWKPVDGCFPQPTPEPPGGRNDPEWLRAIRLRPKGTDSFFVELLAFPSTEQSKMLFWTPCKLDDGWYGLPSFRYLGLVLGHTHKTPSGISYAAPSMMALANLLAHQTIDRSAVIKTLQAGREILRAAKDLGRVLALAWLTDPAELRTWPELWRSALRKRFPKEHTGLAARAGDGLRALLADPDALDQARHSVDIGLLAGHGLNVANLSAVAAQLLGLVLDPLARS